MGAVRPRPTVAVVGLGLVGGSLARALSEAGWSVLGLDRARVLRRAKAAGAIGPFRIDLKAAAREADIIVLAAPPKANLGLLRELAALGTRGAITDVGSVKGPICREAARLGLDTFVGGHPMAGNERSGFSASSPDLFRGRTWIVTGRSSSSMRAVRSMVRAVGARAYAMNAEDHDRAMAFLSHVPQVVSWALLGCASRDAVARKHLAIAGPGFRDMTRLAASPRTLWREILKQNRPEVVRAIGKLARSLQPAERLGARARGEALW